MSHVLVREALLASLAFINKHADDMVVNGSIHPDELNATVDKAQTALAALPSTADPSERLLSARVDMVMAMLEWRKDIRNLKNADLVDRAIAEIEAAAIEDAQIKAQA